MGTNVCTEGSTTNALDDADVEAHQAAPKFLVDADQNRSAG